MLIADRNFAKNLTRDKKEQQVQVIFGEDVRRFHRQLNKIIGKASDPVFPNFNSTTTSDNFNGYFVEVGLNIQKTIPSVPSIHPNMRQIQFMFPISVS